MIKVREVVTSITNSGIDEIKRKTAKRLCVKESNIKEIYIRKKSIDARRDIHFSFEVDVVLDNEDIVLKKSKDKNILKTEYKTYNFENKGTITLKNRPIVVGSGPSGLFAAYLLAESGYKPVVIERGMDVDSRVSVVENFWKTGNLDEKCNVSFGEGGAGTFSDGKLNTLTKDKDGRIQKVFETFVKCGAPSEILYDSKPHIGTDLLRNVVKNIRKEIIDRGGTFYFEKTLTDIDIKDSKVVGITLNGNEYLPCEVLILGIGHSARDTFEMLYNKKIQMKSKPFAVGVRIEHSQKIIDENQYGKYSKYLQPASYKLTYKASNGRGVYSFCMCPGGYVVNASSEKGYTAVNGMSNYKRDSKNANSAIVVTVNEKDYGPGVLDGVKFQKDLERKTFLSLGGKIPVQLWKDFKDGKTSSKFEKITPCIKGAYGFYDINKILPNFISNSIKEAVEYFDTKINGFALDAVISCVESRTSSPVTIERDENMESNIEGLFPIGEGAGYSGGITTSAVDGIKASEKIRLKYKNFTE